MGNGLGGNAEIKYVDSEMKNEIKNLEKIYESFGSIPQIKEQIMEESVGKVKIKIDKNLNLANRINKEFQLLLDNSVAFFNNLSTTFQEADNSCAEKIMEEV